ncbi:ABC transporter ATP-binding protein/permease [Pseudomonas sp. DWRC2-2]|uniref:ABC transporter ATP-binding protein/permease n=1 Tax=Pseudomonas sp. DWRC2-2 TaxID=2804567 RepID=UPI003CF45D64
MIKSHPVVRLLSIYWKSADKWRGAFLVAGILGFGFSNTSLQVFYNGWYADFFNALQQGNAPAFWAAIPMLVLLLAAPMFSQVVQEYLDSWLQLRWRQRTTDHMIGRWLSRKAYYRIERDDVGDNPDQRISEDVSTLIDLTMSLTLRFVLTMVSLASFGYLTWTKGGDLDTELLGLSISIPGYMFWVAVAYSIFDTVITHLAGKSLLNLNVRREATEAELRYSLMQVREHSEQIAMYHGEAVERSRLVERFAAIWQVCKRQFIVNAQVNFTSGLNGRLVSILPLLLMAPNLFAGRIDLGNMMATNVAWISTSVGLSWFARNYTVIAQWRAAALRLRSLDEAIDNEPVEGVRVVEYEGMQMRAEAVTLTLPNGDPLTDVGSFTIAPAHRLIISGRSGVGKSTLLRTIAGLWPHGEGRILLPINAKRLFLPQRSYIPAGSLKAALCYPSPVETFNDEECRQALEECRLPGLKARLHESARWANRLSVGEQQRLGFARALLQKPDLLFVDEATSALDASTEKQLYAGLLRHLPECTLVSVAHHSSLQTFHTHALVLDGSDGASGKIMPLPVAAPV